MSNSQTSQTKPAVLIVPGAWHYPSHYSSFAQALKAQDLVVQCIDLPSVSQCPQPSLDADVGAIRKAITELADAGHNVTLFTHSYGSIPAYNAIKGLDKQTRAREGQYGGVVHMIFCAAFIVPEGKSLIAAFGGNDLPWFKVNSERTIVRPDTPEFIFYNSLAPEQQKANIATLGPFSYQCFHSPVVYAGYKDVPCTYILAELDNALPLSIQESLVRAAEGQWKTVLVNSDHSPFLSRQDECVAIVTTAAGA